MQYNLDLIANLIKVNFKFKIILILLSKVSDDVAADKRGHTIDGFLFRKACTHTMHTDFSGQQ